MRFMEVECDGGEEAAPEGDQPGQGSAEQGDRKARPQYEGRGPRPGGRVAAAQTGLHRAAKRRTAVKAGIN